MFNPIRRLIVFGWDFVFNHEVSPLRDIPDVAMRILQGPGTDSKVIARLSDALKSGRKFEGKAINYKKDGTPFIIYWRMLPIKVGKKITACVAVQREGSLI